MDSQRSKNRLQDPHNRVSELKHQLSDRKIDSQGIKIDSQIPQPINFSAGALEIDPAFCQLCRKKSEKIRYNLKNIEKCTSIIAIIFQKYGCKSSHRQYCKYEIHFTPRAQEIGSQRP